MPHASKRLKELDILRAAAILMIVFFHLPGDLSIVPGSAFFRVINTYAGFFGVVLFFFLSGFSIDLNNKGIRTLGDTARFYVKRAKRIFPLYWVATGFSLLVPFLYLRLVHATLPFATQADLSPAAIAASVLGVQTLLGSGNVEAYRWFVSVLLIYYLLYPAITYFSKDSVNRIIAISASLFFCLLAMRFTFDVFGDDKLFVYFSFFIAGIITNRTNLFYSGAMKKELIASFALIVAVLMFIYLNTIGDLHIGTTTGDFVLGEVLSYPVVDLLNFIYLTVLGLFFIILAFYAAKAHARALSETAAVFYFCVATASYAVFLFHQQLVIALRLGFENVLHLGILGTASIIILIALPLLFVVSFYEQRAEPRVVNRILHQMTAQIQIMRKS